MLHQKTPDEVTYHFQTNCSRASRGSCKQWWCNCSQRWAMPTINKWMHKDYKMGKFPIRRISPWSWKKPKIFPKRLACTSPFPVASLKNLSACDFSLDKSKKWKPGESKSWCCHFSHWAMIARSERKAKYSKNVRHENCSPPPKKHVCKIPIKYMVKDKILNFLNEKFLSKSEKLLWAISLRDGHDHH